MVVDDTVWEISSEICPWASSFHRYHMSMGQGNILNIIWVIYGASEILIQPSRFPGLLTYPLGKQILKYLSHFVLKVKHFFTIHLL